MSKLTEVAQLREALLRSYSARANLFHGAIARSKMRQMFSTIDSAKGASLDLQNDGQVREVVTLTSVIYDTDDRDRFMRKLFHIVDRPI